MKKQAGAAIKKIVGKIIRDLKKGRLTEEGMAEIWEGVVGGAAAGHTRPKSFRRGNLSVNVDDSSWLYELTLKKREMLGQLKEKFEGKKLKD